MAESSSLSTATTAAKSDLETEELLDRMLTRLALCDDSKLQVLLSKLLPLTLSSLSSNSTAVRNKAKPLNPLFLIFVSFFFFVSFSWIACIYEIVFELLVQFLVIFGVLVY